MKIAKVLALAVSGTLAVMSASSAQGAVTYKYVPGQSTFTNVAPGSSITVNIYLSETVTSPSSSIIAAEDGVFGLGASIKPVANALLSPSTITAVTPDNTDFDAGAGFNAGTVTAGIGKISEAIGVGDADGVPLGNSPALAGSTTPGTEVFLGTVTVIAGQTPGTTTFNVGAYGTSGTSITFLDGYDVDSNQTSSPAFTGVGALVSPFTVTVPAPEPASIGLIGLSALGLLVRRKRVAL